MGCDSQFDSLYEVDPKVQARREAAYLICQERGHTPSDFTLTSSPPQQQCRHCGVRYRYESTLIELSRP
jgi:hypothetical protein